MPNNTLSYELLIRLFQNPDADIAELYAELLSQSENNTYLIPGTPTSIETDLSNRAIIKNYYSFLFAKLGISDMPIKISENLKIVLDRILLTLCYFIGLGILWWPRLSRPLRGRFRKNNSHL
jgi:hypothetical protein